MPEVKRVKTKLKGNEVKEQDINMQEGGVPIFQGHFSIATAYNGLALSSVQLASEQGCANTAHAFASKIAAQMELKYPHVLAPLPSESKFMLTSLDATPTTPTKLNVAFATDTTVAFLTSHFYEEAMPRFVGTGALALSIYKIGLANYERRANACAGTGYRTARMQITYVTRKAFEGMLANTLQQAVEQEAQAGDNL